MNLIEIDLNVKFTDITLIRTESRNKLKSVLRNEEGKEVDDILKNAINIGWKTYLSEALKLIESKVIVCNSVDLSKYLEKNYSHPNDDIQSDVIRIELGDINVPCVLFGQVSDQRATDKLALIRLRNSIKNAIKN